MISAFILRIVVAASLAATSRRAAPMSAIDYAETWRARCDLLDAAYLLETER